ncbi:MAG: hypothetical protein OXG49_10130 [Chloroflexi bacterium]|nr:hypothetical protein [Chloroflexota bacterium]
MESQTYAVVRRVVWDAHAESQLVEEYRDCGDVDMDALARVILRDADFWTHPMFVGKVCRCIRHEMMYGAERRVTCLVRVIGSDEVEILGAANVGGPI